MPILRNLPKHSFPYISIPLLLSFLLITSPFSTPTNQSASSKRGCFFNLNPLQIFQQKHRMGNCETTPAPLELQQHERVSRPTFNPFFETNAQQANEHSILSQYKFVSTYEDRFLGRCSVLESHSSGDLFLAKDIVFSGEEECEGNYAKLKEIKEKEEKSEEVLRIKELFCKKIDGFFSDSSKVTILVEYPLTNLKKEVNNRMLNKLEFEREEITNILYSAIRGYATIEKAGSHNDKVRLAHIFVGVKQKDSLIKVVDSSLLPGPTNFQSLKLYGPNSAEHYDVYLSPEELKAYYEKEEPVRSQKCGVFSLGAVILDLCLMESSRGFYHFHKKAIDYHELKNYISIAGKKHGQNIEKFLLEMLEVDPTKRPNFTELLGKIPTIFAQNLGLNSLRLSVVRDENSRYVRNDNKSLRSSRSSHKSMSSSRSNSSNRMFASNVQVPKPQDEQLQNIHEEYTNGNQYIGQKKQGLKHGKGKYIFKDRSYYEGSWKNNKMHGKGQLYFPNGKVQYTGEWREDEPNGWGVMYALEGSAKPVVWSKYEGEFARGEMQGRGKLWFNNGTIFEGEFRSGKIFGRGRKIQASGTVAEKDWGIISLEDLINRGEGSFKREEN